MSREKSHALVELGVFLRESRRRECEVEGQDESCQGQGKTAS